MIKFNDATVEQLIADLTIYEDMSTSLVIMTASDEGGISIFDYEGRYEVEAMTLKEALIDYARASGMKESSIEVQKECLEYGDEMYYKIDWSDL